jgi:regulator of sigma E protease
MLGSFLIFLLILSLLVLVHELGHFWVAKKVGIKVEEFGFGIPPRLWGKKYGETIYSLNLFPFGGFVRLYGEDAVEKPIEPDRAFSEKSKLVRLAVVVAGVIMNFLLAVAAFSLVYSFSGLPRTPRQVVIANVIPGSPAQIAGLLVGDVIVKVEKTAVSTYDQFYPLIEQSHGKRITLEIKRTVAGQFEVKKIKLTPRTDPPEGEGPLGVEIPNLEYYYPPLWQRPFFGIYYGVKEALGWGKNILISVVSLFGELFRGQLPADVSGPVGIFAVTTAVSKIGVLALINFVGILSVNLAILNILPFPALDGGRLLFLFLEKTIGKRVKPKLETALHTLGMILLVALLLALTVRDIKRLITAGGISGFINSVLK